MNCPKCSSAEVTLELRTGADGGPAGLQPHCMDCGHQWDMPKFEAPDATQRMPKVLPATAKPQPKTAQPSRTLTPRSLISEAKRELKLLDREISRLKKLELRRAELARLLDAAKSTSGQLVSLRCAGTKR